MIMMVALAWPVGCGRTGSGGWPGEVRRAARCAWAGCSADLGEHVLFPTLFPTCSGCGSLKPEISPNDGDYGDFVRTFPDPKRVKSNPISWMCYNLLPTRRKYPRVPPWNLPQTVMTGDVHYGAREGYGPQGRTWSRKYTESVCASRPYHRTRSGVPCCAVSCSRAARLLGLGTAWGRSGWLGMARDGSGPLGTARDATDRSGLWQHGMKPMEITHYIPPPSTTPRHILPPSTRAMSRPHSPGDEGCSRRHARVDQH